MTERVRLLIAEAHPIIRAGLQDGRDSQPDFDVIGEATADAETAVELTG